MYMNKIYEIHKKRLSLGCAISCLESSIDSKITEHGGSQCQILSMHTRGNIL